MASVQAAVVGPIHQPVRSLDLSHPRHPPICYRARPALSLPLRDQLQRAIPAADRRQEQPCEEYLQPRAESAAAWSRKSAPSDVFEQGRRHPSSHSPCAGHRPRLRQQQDPQVPGELTLPSVADASDACVVGTS